MAAHKGTAPLSGAAPSCGDPPATVQAQHMLHSQVVSALALAQEAAQPVQTALAAMGPPQPAVVPEGDADVLSVDEAAMSTLTRFAQVTLLCCDVCTIARQHVHLCRCTGPLAFPVHALERCSSRILWQPPGCHAQLLSPTAQPDRSLQYFQVPLSSPQ